MNSFTAIDFETAKDHHICAVGIVTVENGRITEEFYSLVKPPRNEYSWHCTQIHSISAIDTHNSKTFVEIYPEIKKRLAQRFVVAHNEAFDRTVLQKSMIENGLAYSDLGLPERWGCTMKLCRLSPKYPSGELSECCMVDGIELNHHEALSDARACAKLFLNAL